MAGLPSRQDLADYVGTPSASDAVLLDQALAAAITAVEDHCRRRFEPVLATAAARIFPGGRSTVPVDDLTVTPTLVEASEDLLVWQSVSLSEVVMLPPGRRDHTGRELVWTEFAVRDRLVRDTWWRVTARWGWPSVPEPVRQAILEQAKDLYSARLLRHGVVLTDMGPTSTRVNRLVAQLLGPYVRWDRTGIA